MRIAATISPLRAVALVAHARTGHGHEHGVPLPAPMRLVAAPVHASATFLAQSIAQELMAEGLPPDAALADGYLPKPCAAFEGLNFSAVA